MDQIWIDVVNRDGNGNAYSRVDGSMTAHLALLIVDVQNDFCDGGALPVPGGVRVIPSINRHAADAAARGWRVYASRDWHPAITAHFKAFGGPWPTHCVQYTPGAAFHDALHLPHGTREVYKGQDPEDAGYSAMSALTADGRTLLDELQRDRISRLYVTGLATDYCVKTSVLDALKGGIAVTVLTDGIAGIDVTPGDCDRAIADMQAAGAIFTADLG
jgi:nicotinamidase/pyrazinamidase